VISAEDRVAQLEQGTGRMARQPYSRAPELPPSLVRPVPPESVRDLRRIRLRIPGD
jgi:hypothetical protein